MSSPKRLKLSCEEELPTPSLLADIPRDILAAHVLPYLTADEMGILSETCITMACIVRSAVRAVLISASVAVPVLASDPSHVRRIPYINATHAVIAASTHTTANLPHLDRVLLPRLATVELCVPDLSRPHAETDSRLSTGHYNFPADMPAPPKIVTLRTNAVGVNALLASPTSRNAWSHLELLTVDSHRLPCAMNTLIEFINTNGHLSPTFDPSAYRGWSEFRCFQQGALAT